MKTAIVLNTHSRQAGKLAEQVTKLLKKQLNDHEIVKVIIIKNLDKLDKHLDELSRIKNLECVIVGSGDGTLVAVLNKLKNRKNLVYGFLPLGTSNTFVRSLGISADYKKAIKNINNGHTSKVSLGEVNGHLFANMAGVGLPVRVSENISNTTKKYLGPIAYILSGLSNLMFHQAFSCDIKADGKNIQFRTHHLLIANAPYHGDLPVSKKASAYNNQLVIVSFGTGKSRLKYTKSMLRFGLQNHTKDPDTKIIPFKKATIKTKPIRKVEIDGEVVTKTPAKLLIRPKAITVFTPKKTKLF